MERRNLLKTLLIAPLALLVKPLQAAITPRKKLVEFYAYELSGGAIVDNRRLLEIPFDEPKAMWQQDSEGSDTIDYYDLDKMVEKYLQGFQDVDWFDKNQEKKLTQSFRKSIFNMIKDNTKKNNLRVVNLYSNLRKEPIEIKNYFVNEYGLYYRQHVPSSKSFYITALYTDVDNKLFNLAGFRKSPINI